MGVPLFYMGAYFRFCRFGSHCDP